MLLLGFQLCGRTFLVLIKPVGGAVQNPEAARSNLKMAQTLAPYLFEPFYNGGTGG